MIEEVEVEKIAFNRYRLLVQESIFSESAGHRYPVTALVMSHEEVLRIINALQQSVQADTPKRRCVWKKRKGTEFYDVVEE